MMKKIGSAIVSTLIFFQIAVGQTAVFKNDNPFPSGSNSGVLVSSSAQSLPDLNQSPIERFISEFYTAIYSSKVLPDVLDFSGLSPGAFSQSLYDFIYSSGIGKHDNPTYVASTVANAIKEGIGSYTLPVMLDIYANTFAKYLFAKGTLNPSNAATLAKKFAATMEDISERKWAKDIPETKFGVLQDSFVAYMKSVEPVGFDWYEDISLQLVKELKKIAAKS